MFSTLTLHCSTFELSFLTSPPSPSFPCVLSSLNPISNTMQRNALACFSVQLELARLTDSLPPDVDYDELLVTLAEKMNDASGTTPCVYDQLESKQIVLPDADGPNTAAHVVAKPITVFLFDVEGTTTAVPFFRQVLLPLAAAQVGAFVKEHFPSDPEFVSLLSALVEPVTSPTRRTPRFSLMSFAEAFIASREQNWKDEEVNAATREQFCALFRDDMDYETADPAVKAVQAVVYADLFADKKLHSHVFPDVDTFFRFAGGPDMSKRTHIALYSTDSVAAQKLIMANTEYGDLNPFVTAYFDPALVGTKLSPKSYMKICTLLSEQLAISPEDMDVVFVTDNASEASAAETSGAVGSSVLCLRPLNTWVTFDTILPVNVPYITSFEQLMRRECDVSLEKMVNSANSVMAMAPSAE